jgi:hypothetical protein
MKPHRILKSFRGSNDHHNTLHFEAGTVQPLSDSLAAIVVKEGWAEPHVEQPPQPAENRETKVVEPDEVKAEEETPKKKRK